MEHKSSKALACAWLAAFALAHWIVPALKLPTAWLPFANVLATLIFLTLPLLFVYHASRLSTSGVLLGIVLIGTLGLFVSTGVLGSKPGGPLATLLVVTSQTALLVAASAAGMLVSLAVREPNMLVPIAPVLALVDIATVLSPVGPARQVIEKAPEVFEQVAVRVPAVGSSTPLAFIGPADVLFLAMFFAVLHRAGFRARETLLWLIPTLVAYMLFVLLFGHLTVHRFRLASLPALVPVALVVLLVNRRCFSLSLQEKRMTWVLVVLTATITVVLLAYPFFS